MWIRGEITLQKKILSFLFISLLLAMGLLSILFSWVESGKEAVSGGTVIYWDRVAPLLLLGTFAMSIAWMRATVILFRKYDDANPDGQMRPIFKNDEKITVYAALAGLASPFLIQPIMDLAVFPALGYEYCEELSYRSETFRFPTYAYVPDPALCVAAEAQ